LTGGIVHNKKTRRFTPRCPTAAVTELLPFSSLFATFLVLFKDGKAVAGQELQHPNKLGSAVRQDNGQKRKATGTDWNRKIAKWTSKVINKNGSYQQFFLNKIKRFGYLQNEGYLCIVEQSLISLRLWDL
jgi:hypothetical protein